MGSEFGAIWEDPEGGFIKLAVKRALKQDQTLHMEGKFHVIFYFMGSVLRSQKEQNRIIEIIILNNFLKGLLEVPTANI